MFTLYSIDEAFLVLVSSFKTIVQTVMSKQANKKI